MTSHDAAMAASGITIAVLIPSVILATGDWPAWGRMIPPASAALPGFVALHGMVVLSTALLHPRPLARLLLEAALLAGGVFFWLPVVGPGTRLSEPARCLYLFLAGPLLDLPAVVLIALGHTTGGLAMIVAMLPVGLAAMGLTWRWITAEESEAARAGTARR